MNAVTKQEGAQLLERVVIGGDLAKLSPAERMQYYAQVCESVGLNPLTRPFEYITLNGKLTLYARRDATDQLRSLKNVSIEIKSRETVGDLYVVTAKATNKDGRTDESLGAVNLKGFAGDVLANQLMKCETKAKRRVTLSICGLGLLDETEVETIPGATSGPITPSTGVLESLTAKQQQRVFDIATYCKALLAEGKVGEVVQCIEQTNPPLDNEEKIALWIQFDSKQKSAIKRQQAAEQQQSA